MKNCFPDTCLLCLFFSYSKKVKTMKIQIYKKYLIISPPSEFKKNWESIARCVGRKRYPVWFFSLSQCRDRWSGKRASVFLFWDLSFLIAVLYIFVYSIIYFSFSPCGRRDYRSMMHRPDHFHAPSSVFFLFTAFIFPKEVLVFFFFSLCNRRTTRRLVSMATPVRDWMRIDLKTLSSLHIHFFPYSVLLKAKGDYRPLRKLLARLSSFSLLSDLGNVSAHHQKRSPLPSSIFCCYCCSGNRFVPLSSIRPRSLSLLFPEELFVARPISRNVEWETGGWNESIC